MPEVDISVVIGFKDWGRDRLLASVTSLTQAFAPLNGEVIVSDFGSDTTDQEDLERRLSDIGARYIYTSTDGVWSRSRALNAGFAVARGAVLISTDADMVFSPGSLGIVGQRLAQDPKQAIVLQCRDLPEQFSEHDLIGMDVNWDALERASRLRPRWGMGGMMATTRAAFLRVRGLDERMKIYGGEDIDFATRLRRSGCRIEWIDDPRVRMYHMWHAPTRRAVSATREGELAIEANRDIYLNDPSYIRNTTDWTHAPPARELPITVAIATHNRAEYLPEAINSVLAQTVSDFELIIVDDGSTDDTPDVVASFSDERIRYFRRENSGIAAARNFAADQSRGTFTAVHDDDDLMLPWRLESHLRALSAGVHGTYGGWIDFDNETGAINPLHGKDLNLGSILFSGKVYLHPTMMIETSLLRRVRYNETFRSGSDYNLGLRLVRSGVKMLHTGEFHTLRRLHGGQISENDPGTQKSSAVLSSFMARAGMSTQGHQRLRQAQKEVKSLVVRGAQDPMTLVAPYLPDHLVRRSATVTSDAESISGNARDWLASNATRHITVTTPDGRPESQFAYLSGLSLAQMADLRRLRLDVEMHAETAPKAVNGNGAPHSDAMGLGSAVRSLISRMKEELVGPSATPYIAVLTEGAGFDIDLKEFDAAMVRSDRIITDNGVARHVTVLAGAEQSELSRMFRWITDTRPSAHPMICAPVDHDSSELIRGLARQERSSR